MDTRSLTELIHFDEESPRTTILTESANLWSQVVCLQGAQGVGPMRDARAEGLVLVLAGEVSAQIGKSRARMKQWATTTVPSGEELTLRNASSEPAVVLLVLSPPPAAGEA
jgi:glyoxylate utilization-related uncharacterized protein